MNTNTPDPITEAFDQCLVHYGQYISKLQEGIKFDPGRPADLLRFMGSFAGSCDTVDEDKNIIFDHLFTSYAVQYFRHFKSASEKEKASQRSANEPCSVDGSLIDYVESAETEREFWENLRNNSSNIYYLWSTSTDERKDHVHVLYHEARKMLFELEGMMQKYQQQDQAD
jgi:hypothetical protein